MSTILAELAAALDFFGESAIDWITFVGSGETTLFSRLGSLIRYVKSISDIPVAVITNGSLLSLPGVRRELLAADAVLPSLDAGTEKLFRRVNRPHPGLSFDRYVGGLVKFREAYRGKLWVEVMLVAGVNDSRSALLDIASILERIEADEVHLTTPTRPPVEAWVQPPDKKSLESARAILGGDTRLLHRPDPQPESAPVEEISDAVLNIVSRHPMQESELVHALARFAPGQVSETIAGLSTSGKVQVVKRFGKRFWCAAAVEVPEFSAEIRSPTR
jgi:wyosine [tRNA(Phe)-imidazoG37] synthetase (radical SAM superfamily)